MLHKHYGIKGTYIEKHDQNIASLCLLAKGGNTEVLIQEITEGEVVVIDPGSEKQMEFFMILEGEINYKGSDSDPLDIVLGPQDYFYMKDGMDHILFKTLTDVKLIYFSSEPVFHYLSQVTSELIQLAKEIEEKDDYTLGHIKRVQSYSLGIAEQLDFGKEQLEKLGYASIFHDLGKVNVPNEILNKPGKLTKEEFEIIKKHSHDGSKMVKDTYYEGMGTIINQHHEKMDGTGYPNGLKGDEIVLEARIIAVADAYDAMTTNRPYRKSLDSNVAIAELERCSGIQFDKVVVDAFLEFLKETIK